MTNEGPASEDESDREGREDREDGEAAEAPERDPETGPSVEAGAEGGPGPTGEDAEPPPGDADGPDREAEPDSDRPGPGSAVGTDGPSDVAGGSPRPSPGGGAEQLQAAPPAPGTEPPVEEDDLPEDVRSYDRFQKVDRASYDRVNEFLRDRTYITAREWAIARLCADFRTATGVEMTKIGEHLPELVPFMTDTYSPQAVNQARSAFEGKVRMAGATFLYGAMSGFFTADELDELMYEVTEVAKFLLEVEGVELAVEEELDAEDRISTVMREVRRASEELRYDEVACPHCGQGFRPDAGDD